MLAPDDIAIHRLQVRGDKRTSEQWVRDLSTTHWAQPLPSQLHNAWVLVRELKVKGKSCDLRRETAQRLSSQLQQAQRANHANAASANVIWFASFPELLAFLLVDLARGNPAYWYWSRWAHLLKYSRQEGVARLLCEQVEFLPAVIEQLRNNGNLPLVWKQLSAGTAMTLVRELARCGRVSYPDTWQAAQEYEATEQGPIRTYLHMQRPQQVYWRSLLTGLQPDDGRVFLAAIIQGLAAAPQWLQRRPALWMKLWAEMTLVPAQNHPSPQVLPPASVTDTHRLAGESDAIRTQVPAPTSPELGGEPLMVSDRLKSGQNQRKDGFAVAPAPVPIVSIPVDKEVTQGNSHTLPQASIHPAIIPASAKRDIARNSLGDIHASLIPAADVITITDSDKPSQANQHIGESLSTAMGGFFYLLNPLNHLFANNLAIPATDMSPGIFLWDVYRALVEQFPSLPECMEQSLADFFWHLAYSDLEFNARRQLIKQRESLQPIAQARQCVAQLGTLPDAQALWQSLVQGSAFLQVPARVVTTASHWDIYFPLAHVRLDLRLAGWDINPGWLPWLGRVVTFHYVESMDHRGEAQP